MTIENCPKCGQQLTTLESSGRQICRSCGWQNQNSLEKLNREKNLENSNILRLFKQKILKLNKIEKTIIISVIFGAVLASIFSIHKFISERDPYICSRQDIKKVESQLEPLIEKWDTANKLAASSPRITLGMPISKLQEIQQQVKEQEFPDCSQNVIKSFVNLTESYIEAYLLFMSGANDVDASIAVDKKIRDAKGDQQIFITSYKRLKEGKSTSLLEVSQEIIDESQEMVDTLEEKINNKQD